MHQFVSLADAREKIEAWRCDNNQVRPHSSLGHLTPSEFVIRGQDNRTAEAAVLLPCPVSKRDQCQVSRKSNLPCIR